MFCHKCGKELPEGAQFCPVCGNKAITEENQPAEQKIPADQPLQRETKSYLAYEDGICPNCGSHDCEIQVQQNVTGSGKNYNAGAGCLGFLLTGPFGLLCGLCGTGSKTTTTYKSMWVCKKCGNQFPTRQDRVSSFNTGIALFCCILTCFIVLSVFSAVGGLWPLAILLFAIAAGLFWLIKYAIKKNLGEGSLHEVLTDGILTEQEYSILRSCIHKRLSKEWKCEILTIASAEEMEIS